jgi:hypothetical protein
MRFPVQAKALLRTVGSYAPLGDSLGGGIRASQQCDQSCYPCTFNNDTICCPIGTTCAYISGSPQCEPPS